MKTILHDEYDAFISAIECQRSEKAVRINRLKLKDYSISDFGNISLSTIEYAEDCHIINDCEGIGHTPEHHAGIFYAQDPGAMAPVSSLSIEPDFKILDLCAAPGGKSGQAAAKLGRDGFILSNEFVPKRAKMLVGNFERLGIKNGLVTSLDTSAFPKLYDSFFDLVILDAPCSGEGMFRKNSDAIQEWSPANVKACALRQREILENASGLVKDGGYLLYSTCTYSTEENEEVVDAFLKSHTDYELISVKDEIIKSTASGIKTSDEMTTNIYKTRRFYSHISRGEGQFIALLKRNAPLSTPKILFKDASSPITKEESKIVENFFKKNLEKNPEASLRRHGNNIYLISHGLPLPKNSVFSAGVLLGEIRSGVLFPSHQLFSAYGELFSIKVELSEHPELLKKYLHGEEITIESARSGWCSVQYKGASLGGGKISNGKMKNHYPKGLREN